MKSKIGVSHWVDGQKTWSLGIQGLLIRVRAYVFQIFLALPLLGVPFWWQNTWPTKIAFSTKSTIIHLGILLLVFSSIIFFYLRFRVRRSLRIKAGLHQLSHDLRDCLCDTLQQTAGRKGRPSKQNPIHHRKHLKSISDKAANLIAEYFEAITGDTTIGCAIRLAEDPISDGKDRVQYVTVGRSDRLNANRQKSSDPIPRNSGIPKFFLSDERACQGVLLYDDLAKATTHGAYHPTRNDKLHPDDFNAMVAAPLNGWNGRKKDLTGILCITSRTGGILKVSQIDLFKFTADHLSLFYTGLISRLQSIGEMPTLTEEAEETEE